MLPSPRDLLLTTYYSPPTTHCLPHTISDQADSQADVYAALGPPVLQMLQRGHNASVFAYGQTGSGKTYTMLGTEEAQGLVPRTLPLPLP